MTKGTVEISKSERMGFRYIARVGKEIVAQGCHPSADSAKRAGQRGLRDWSKHQAKKAAP